MCWLVVVVVMVVVCLGHFDANHVKVSDGWWRMRMRIRTRRARMGIEDVEESEKRGGTDARTTICCLCICSRLLSSPALHSPPLPSPPPLLLHPIIPFHDLCSSTCVRVAHRLRRHGPWHSAKWHPDILRYLTCLRMQRASHTRDPGKGVRKGCNGAV